jgi:hypothetical protein
MKTSELAGKETIPSRQNMIDAKTSFLMRVRPPDGFPAVPVQYDITGT